MDTNKKPEGNTGIPGTGAKKEPELIAAHEEEKLLEAYNEEDTGATGVDFEQPEEVVEPVSTHRGWTSGILAVLGLCGVLLLAALIYSSHQRHQLENLRQDYASAGYSIESVTLPAVNVAPGAFQPVGMPAAPGRQTYTAASVVSDAAAKAAAANIPVVVYLFPVNGHGVTGNAALDNVARQAVDGNMYVVVDGYCDESGSPAYNQKLSQQRAESVGEYIRSRGVPAAHIVAKGHGGTHAYPTAVQDRRCEISLKN